jgi:hypothetical protein
MVRLVANKTLHFIPNAAFSRNKQRDVQLSSSMAVGRWLNRLLASGCKHTYLREGRI